MSNYLISINKISNCLISINKMSNYLISINKMSNCLISIIKMSNYLISINKMSNYLISINKRSNYLMSINKMSNCLISYLTQVLSMCMLRSLFSDKADAFHNQSRLFVINKTRQLIFTFPVLAQCLKNGRLECVNSGTILRGIDASDFFCKNALLKGIYTRDFSAKTHFIFM